MPQLHVVTWRQCRSTPCCVAQGCCCYTKRSMARARCLPSALLLLRAQVRMPLEPALELELELALAVVLALELVLVELEQGPQAPLYHPGRSVLG